MKQLSKEQIDMLIIGMDYLKDQSRDHISTIYPGEIETEPQYINQLRDCDMIIETLVSMVSDKSVDEYYKELLETNKNTFSIPAAVQPEEMIILNAPIPATTDRIRRTKFCIDSYEVVYEGWTHDNRWNGWECPMFEKEVADEVMNNFITDCQPAHYDEETDTYTFIMDPDDPESTETYTGRDIRIPITPSEDKIIHVYDIGAYCWVWDEYEESDDCEDEE